MNSDLPSSNTIWQETVAQEQQTIFLFLIHWYADGWQDTDYTERAASKSKKHTTKYSVEYKLEAIRPVMGQGMSQKAAADQLNLPDCSILLQWLRLYRLNGINGLKPKP